MKSETLISGLYGDQAANPVILSGDLPKDAEITGIHYSSAGVSPGGIFVAIKGTRSDGHDYIADAVAHGAAAVVAERPVDSAGVPLILVKDARRALARLAATFYGNPSESLTIIVVTGTNGKSTVSYFIESVLAAAGFSVGVIGTVNYRFAGRTEPSPMTTPDAADLQALLARMRDSGVTHVVMEVSSHALVQGRTLFCSIDVAVFTNLSQDHLDYHKDMEAYFSAKGILFTEYPFRNGDKTLVSVVNGDDPYGLRLCGAISTPLLRAGLADGADIRGVRVMADESGIRGDIETPAGTVRVNSPLVGMHNFYNAMSATGVGAALGITPSAISRGIADLAIVPGRLERVENDLGRHVFIDYAHTPDALEKVLTSLNGIKTGRIITVMGCGGDRDRAKRPLMGAVAALLSDLLVITSDNPRTEDPEAIMAQIIPGAALHKRELAGESLSGPGFLAEPDRSRAIDLAVRASRAGDTILVAGKGHEDYQIIGTRKRHFDDRREAARALAELGGRN